MLTFFKSITHAVRSWFMADSEDSDVVEQDTAQIPAQTPLARAEVEAIHERSDPRVELGNRSQHRGYETAIKSGLPEKDAEVGRSLDAEAIALAAAAHRPPSPTLDQRRMTRLVLLEETRKRQIVDRDRAAIHVGTAKGEQASLGASQPYPSISSVLQYSSLIGLSVSIAPTFHDMCVGLDPILKWAVGGACAAGVSLFIIHGIIPGRTAPIAADPKAKARRPHNAAAAGYLMGAALATIRIAGARTVQDLLLTGALTAAEFSVVWLLERKSKVIQAEILDLAAEQKLRGKAAHELQSREDELARRQEALDATAREMKLIERECEHDYLMGDLKVLNLIATNSIRAGYQAGISRNAGELGGV